MISAAPGWRFYETILETTLDEHAFGSSRIAVFPYGEGCVGGCLDANSAARPASDGVVVYLDVAGRLDRTLTLVEEAGGRVVVPKTALPQRGVIAHVLDSEGNRIGLHAVS